MAPQFGSFDLLCPRCKKSQRVSERPLPGKTDGHSYEYLCEACEEALGTRAASGPEVASRSAVSPSLVGTERPPLRLVFFGTPELARAILRALASRSEWRVVLAVTQPDRPKGRDLKPLPPPVKEEALRLGIPVLQPERARTPEFIEALAGFAPDLIVVAAYGQILTRAVLDLPRFGCLNVHTSLLPKYRGASPIQAALLNGETETGVTIMKMDAGMDTGEIVSLRRVAIEAEDNSQTLHDRLAEAGAALLETTIPDYVSGRIVPEKQPETGVSYAGKIKKEDGRLDWTLPARELWNRVRAFTPWPGAFTYLPAEKKQPLLKIWEAGVVEGVSGSPGEILQAGKEGIVVACGRDALRIKMAQREGGKRLVAREFLAGYALEKGRRFATAPGL